MAVFTKIFLGLLFLLVVYFSFAKKEKENTIEEDD